MAKVVTFEGGHYLELSLTEIEILLKGIEPQIKRERNYTQLQRMLAEDMTDNSNILKRLTKHEKSLKDAESVENALIELGNLL